MTRQRLVVIRRVYNHQLFYRPWSCSCDNTGQNGWTSGWPACPYGLKFPATSCKIHTTISLWLLSLFFGNDWCNVKFYFWDCTSQIWFQIQQFAPSFCFYSNKAWKSWFTEVRERERSQQYQWICSYSTLGYAFCITAQNLSRVLSPESLLAYESWINSKRFLDIFFIFRQARNIQFDAWTYFDRLCWKLPEVFALSPYNVWNIILRQIWGSWLIVICWWWLTTHPQPLSLPTGLADGRTRIHHSVAILSHCERNLLWQKR